MMRIDPYRYAPPPAEGCAIYSLNESLESPPAVISQTFAEETSELTLELTPLADGNTHRLLVATVMTSGLGDVDIDDVTYGGVAVDYAEPINGGQFTIVASLIDDNQIEDNFLRVALTEAVTGAQVKVQPLWFGNVGAIIYAKAFGPGTGSLFGLPDPAEYESVLFFSCGELGIFDEQALTMNLVFPDLDYVYTEEGFPAVDLRFDSEKIARAAYFVGAFEYANETIDWFFDGWDYRSVAGLMAISLCDVEE